MAECPLLEQEANLHGQRVIERFRALDEEYDRITDHGRRQNAIGPGAWPSTGAGIVSQTTDVKVKSIDLKEDF
ncbi:DUF922 domain-containing protein [Xylophilus sp.]|uniref:DUF922 domain-containing protein n=1 Tax=Xylophilus sp. TaxID=2653893 RepID=UPI0013B6ED4D|nr:DUF922 domain-containing protein [Xylophilus sp.]KAF1047775.1 MAG: hypothetical protein GAK38_01718 [Xylophilus sp.]